MTLAAPLLLCVVAAVTGVHATPHSSIQHQLDKLRKHKETYAMTTAPTAPLIAHTFFVRVAIADFLDLLRDRRSRASSARFSGCGVRFFFCSSAATT
jgi:hypothetical protein